VWVAPLGRELLPPVAGSKWLVHWTSETWWKCEKCRRSTGLPPSNGYGTYGILAVCRINLWPAVRMELGEEGWLKQLVAKVIGSWPVIRDQVGVTTVVRRHLQAIPFQSVGCTPRARTAAPFGGKQTVSPLDQWDMVKVWETQELHSILFNYHLMAPRVGGGGRGSQPLPLAPTPRSTTQDTYFYTVVASQSYPLVHLLTSHALRSCVGHLNLCTG
jgi:hypothetical protein